MLIEFTIENYKSFKDRTTLSMIAANLKSDDPEVDENNVFKINDNLSLLKSAAIYGANASGKSNIGTALKFMQSLILNSSKDTQVTDKIDVEPFLLNTETRDKPSHFEIIFLLDRIQYRYGFEVDKTHVVSEWLFYVPTTKEARLFTRDGQDISVNTTSFKEGKGLEDKTRSNSLFLSVVAQFNGKISQEILSWVDIFNINAGLDVKTGLQDNEYRAFTLDCLRDEQSSGALNQLLYTFDLGFDRIDIADTPTPREISGSESLINKTVLALVDMFSPVQGICTLHGVRDENGNIVSTERFDADVHESHGTRKLITLAGPLMSILAHGIPWFVDEFDARLHPLITRQIIKLFNSKVHNPKGAQLIFVTHDTNLLDKTLFRRDQIWFAEKDRQDSSHLTSLAEFRVRNDAAYEKNYLQGRYGAIPFLSELDRLPEAIHG